MTESETKPDKKKDIKILYAFLAFFGVIFLVNGIFITNAIKSSPGVVTEKAYEKGIAYNEILDQAKSQLVLDDNVSFDQGQLIWRVADLSANKMDEGNMDVRARLIRPIKEGYDLNLKLMPLGNGVFGAPVTLPLNGRWQVMIEAKWNDQSYKTTQMIYHK